MALKAVGHMTAECSRCGECCKNIAIGMVKDLRKVAKDYLKVRGAVFKKGFILIPYECPNLTYEFERVDGWFAVNADAAARYKKEGIPVRTRCDIHEKKPAICKEWKGNRTVRGFPTYVPDCCALKVRP